jgi:hypothetical protein
LSRGNATTLLNDFDEARNSSAAPIRRRSTL